MSISSLVVALMVAASTAAATSQATLAGVTLGEPVVKTVKLLGPPTLVQTTDDGHEWRWYNAAGLDVDVLTDDSLGVREILVARPEAVGGKQSPLVQPKEYPLLELSASDAGKKMSGIGRSVAVPDTDKQRVWEVGQDIIVLQLTEQAVRKILALDRQSAGHLGYLGMQPRVSHRAPRLVRQVAVDYPKRAIASHAEGVVVVRVDVASSGAVSDVKVVVSSGNDDIDKAEMESMRKSTFAPARCDDQPCAGVFYDREEYNLDP